MSRIDPNDGNWRGQRRSGMVAIAVGSTASAGLWFILIKVISPLSDVDTPSERVLIAFKCIAVAALFCLAAGIEAVAHERLQSPAFDPLAGYENRRLHVNLHYLQNTLEQLAVFSIGLIGLAIYSTDGAMMRLVPATAIVWILARFAFWIGYHRSSALRGLGASSMVIGLLLLIYVVWRIGLDAAGWTGGTAIVLAFFVLEAILFWQTSGGSAAKNLMIDKMSGASPGHAQSD